MPASAKRGGERWSGRPDTELSGSERPEHRRGQETDWTTGLNWFLNPNFLFKFNYTKVAKVTGGKFAGVSPNEFLLRAQAYW